MPNDEYFENVAEPIVVKVNFKDIPGVKETLKRAFDDAYKMGQESVAVPHVNLEAAAILMAVEKLHKRGKKRDTERRHEKPFTTECSECKLSDDDYGTFWKTYPCPTLVDARSVASQSTLDYVAEQLKEGK